MLKLLRLALTAAILAAIVVRLRRRAAMPETSALPPAPPPSPGLGPAGLLAATLAAVLGGVAFLGAGLWPRPPEDRMPGPGLIGGGWHATPPPPDPFLYSRPSDSDARSVAAVREPDVLRPPADSSALTPGQAETPGQDSTGRTSDRGEMPDPDDVAQTSERGRAGASSDRGRVQRGGWSCDPVRRPVVVRPVDPQARRAVNRQWRRIERWLRANAPVTYARLDGPGRARTIAVAESQTGLDFPDDLRASLLRHDGARGLVPPGGVSLGVREIRDAWRRLCADGGHTWWTGQMIPVHRHRGAEYAAVDSSGAVVRDGVTAAPSYAALLREIAGALAEEREIDGHRPVVRRGVLRWTPAG